MLYIMTTETRKITIYKANDGSEFLDEEKCKQYETNLEKLKNNFKVFEVYHGPELTETGYLLSKMYVFVYSEHFHHYELVYNYMVKEEGYPIIGPSVQGYYFQEYFRIRECEHNIKDIVSAAKVNRRKCILMCPEKFQKELIETFDMNIEPENIFDYMKKWNFK